MITTAITLGTLMGTIMMLNVWGIIWRNQKIVIGLKEGDAVAAGAKAALASRTNTLLSLPMLYFMVSSAHGGSAAYPKSYLLIDGYLSTGFWIVFVAVLLIEMNAIFGKMFPVITSVRSVITSSLLLTIKFVLDWFFTCKSYYPSFSPIEIFETFANLIIFSFINTVSIM